MKYYLGIDGGGTKTTAIICDENAQLISRFVGESINYNSVGMETARKNLKATVDGVLPNDVKLNAAFIGMSAISERADDEFTKKLCEGIIDCDKITMDSDVYIGLEAMRCDGSAAMVISGTGSMAVGRLPDGEIIHTGGWGYILGDEGSGYAICIDALRAAICGYEGSAEKTLLTDAVKEHYQVNDMLELIDIFYDPPMPRSEIAKLAPIVFKCSENDGVADAIIRNHAQLLANTVSALLSQLPEGTPLGLWGGIFENYEKFRNLFSASVNERFPETEINVLEYAPEYGAVFAAIKTDGE
ncbi:MAG: BadF/BadG/BcrA/BcrD ATPase family protein [Acutalibacteraceae bacterium]|nr:BadF/BadG/BcrA/BcrD ATPase family protein [Acutalibacteraceae bacterium]